MIELVFEQVVVGALAEYVGMGVVIGRVAIGVDENDLIRVSKHLTNFP